MLGCHWAEAAPDAQAQAGYVAWSDWSTMGAYPLASQTGQVAAWGSMVTDTRSDWAIGVPYHQAGLASYTTSWDCDTRNEDTSAFARPCVLPPTVLVRNTFQGTVPEATTACGHIMGPATTPYMAMELASAKLEDHAPSLNQIPPADGDPSVSTEEEADGGDPKDDGAPIPDTPEYTFMDNQHLDSEIVLPPSYDGAWQNDYLTPGPPPASGRHGALAPEQFGDAGEFLAGVGGEQLPHANRTGAIEDVWNSDAQAYDAYDDFGGAPSQVLCLAQAVGDPRLGTPELPTMGSAGHHARACKPCAFLEKGCMSGVECKFCHLCPADEKKRRKKEKLSARRQMSRWQKTASNTDSWSAPKFGSFFSRRQPV